MKKIGILTFHNCLNMGAALQAFALNKYLNYLNYKTDTINQLVYCTQNIYIIEILKYLKYKNEYNNRYKGIFKYIKLLYNFKFFFRNISLSKICFNYKNINKLKYNTIVIGSDQVWNNNYYIDINNIFFGYNLNTNNIISYAASGINNYLSEKEEEKLKNNLSKFKSISVRENFMVNYLRQLLNRDIKLVCDPTFLIDKDEYEKLALKSKIRIKDKFIFVYNINESKLLNDISNIYRDKYGYSIYELNRTCKLNNNKFIGPIDFLYLIKNAEYVLTDSFHGTALSIILEKKFYTYASGQGKDRYLTILKKADLTNRLIDDNFIFSEKKIDYKKVKENLTPFIEYSKNYLKENI